MKKRISWAFVPTPNAVKKNPSWRVMSLHARRVLDCIELEWSKSHGEQNGRLIVPYKTLKAHSCAANSTVIANAQREIEALGLAAIIHGKAGDRGRREPNMFGLTYLPIDGRPATNEWSEIKTIEEAKMRQAEAKASRTQSDWFKTRQLAKVPRKAKANGAAPYPPAEGHQETGRGSQGSNRTDTAA